MPDIFKLCLAGAGVVRPVDSCLQAEDGCDRDDQSGEHVVKEALGKYFFISDVYLPSLLLREIPKYGRY